jgi:hypothetical protein
MKSESFFVSARAGEAKVRVLEDERVAGRKVPHARTRARHPVRDTGVTNESEEEEREVRSV